MKTVLVTYHLPGKPPRAVILERFIGAANNIFKNLPGLLSKQFCYDETTGNGHSVYLWNPRHGRKSFFLRHLLSISEKSLAWNQRLPTLISWSW